MRTSITTLFVLTLLISAGCTNFVGSISRTTSEFDGSTQISMVPAWTVPAGGSKMGAYWNTKMTGDTAIIPVMVAGASGISGGKSLHFNIDGEIIDFTSIDATSEYTVNPGYVGGGIYIPPSNWATKRYEVPLLTMTRICASQKTTFKIDLDREFIDGTLLDQLTLYKPALCNFVQEVSNFKNGKK